MAKKDGNFRPVVNLKPLNSLVMKQQFKMEPSAALKYGALEGEPDVCCRIEGDVSLRVNGTRTSVVPTLYVGQQQIQFACPPLD